jgi:hypothetical protein
VPIAPSAVKRRKRIPVNADVVFQITSTLAIIGWLALLATPWRPALAQLIAARVIPVLLALVYAGLIIRYFRADFSAFQTLDGVISLFTSREVVLAGWIHYLAFDLFVGAWEARVSDREGIPFLLTIPCLFFTLMLGPIGFLMFIVLRSWTSTRSNR